jgi:hypothetical protein
MADQPTCEFVVLAYVSDPTQETLLPIAVAGRELSLGKPRGLILHVAVVVGTTVSERHQEYLYDLFESWRTLDNDKLDELFRDIRELSSGPLRTQDSGFCSSDDLPRLAGEVLGPHQKMDVSTGNKYI